MTEFLVQIIIASLDKMGWFGGFLFMALESMIAPVPSEAVMPPLGMLVAQNKMLLWVAILSTSAGSLVGSYLSYAMGYWGGKPAVLKLGKWLFLNEHHLAWTEKWFHTHGGITIFVGRFVPVVRHLISIPAGIGKMPLLPFTVYTLIGATLWNGFLLWLGMRLQEHWEKIMVYRKPLDVVVIVLILVGCVWFFVSHVLPGLRSARAARTERK